MSSLFEEADHAADGLRKWTGFQPRIQTIAYTIVELYARVTGREDKPPPAANWASDSQAS
jgi:hypothetical protein